VTASRPYYAAAARNAVPIAETLAGLLKPAASVLEIGAGTGQHAACIFERRPDLLWQASDLPGQIAGIQAWLDDAGLPLPALPLDVECSDWPPGPWDAVYASNVCHIVSWQGVCALFAGAGRVLKPGGLLLIYGPFNRHGRHTSDGNRLMDQSLRAGGSGQGLRDESDLDDLADKVGLVSKGNIDMPANNRILVFKNKISGTR
jgi:SAM-dependent methyltransferase